MGIVIKELEIPNDNYFFISENEEKGNAIKSLSKINIFVGKNNSGKSRLLRHIIKNDLKFTTFDDLSSINHSISFLKREMDLFFSRHPNLNGTQYKSYLKNQLDNIDEIGMMENDKDPLSLFKKFMESINHYDTNSYGSDWNFTGEYHDLQNSLEVRVDDPEGNEIHSYLVDANLGELGDELVGIRQKCLDLLDESLEEFQLNYGFEKIYFPILRGLRPLLDGRQYKDLYKERTIEDHFERWTDNQLKERNVTIFTGLDVYNTVNVYSRLNHAKKTLLNQFKKYLSKNFFDGENVEITASVKSENGETDVVTVKIGNEHEKPIHALGDGIQSIIILTLFLFLHKNQNLLIFLEEPEQLLHPGLQRKLIETFLKEEGFENFQFFITTHSNHFLDITLDLENISIFTVKKELDNSNNEEKVPSFSIENLSKGDEKALELLGVRNSSVFLSNCTIWVEGITDRYYIRHYLALYTEFLKKKSIEEEKSFVEFQEDYHYSFVEYGGNNITHWSFLEKDEMPINVKRLCGRLFLIADKDQGKDKRHEQLKNALGDRYYPLKCREIENLVTKDVLLKIVKEYEKLGENEQDNININFTYADYKKNRLGNFIEKKIIIDKNQMKRKSYKMKSGTIKDKDAFLKKAIKNIKTWEDLSPEAKELTTKVHNFIIANNS